MNRPDQYRERARALAIAAGLDPDARIERPGLRSMPTWCTFRDAARAEHVAREQAAAAAEIATIAPQAAAFQNAPLKVFGRHDEARVAQMRNCMAVGNVVAGVICADGHLGYAQPVGGVIAYEKQISISGVGFDIGCGNMAVRLDTPFRAIEDRIGTVIKDVARVISFGVGRTNEERDEDGFVWIGVHFGSRGLCHTSATRYLKAAGGKDRMNVPPAVLDEDGELGRRYIAAMQLAGRYSYAGREWVIERVRKIIGGAVTDMVHNHHNYAWRETHDGRDLWVVRKGATPAFPGQRGFVGGSMGDDAVILEGVEGPEAPASLYSTVHGAGRLFGRKEAKLRFTKAQMDGWLQQRGVTLVGADLDESPMAYRRLPEVLAHHSGSVRVLHARRPFAVAMAGEGEFDPFKD
jgi:tRNA-splicing ligase RtcB (3'-phosphate/5'-hydroxy nucleic acid ligase)